LTETLIPAGSVIRIYRALAARAAR
jgi:hypothetical protein